MVNRVFLLLTGLFCFMQNGRCDAQLHIRNSSFDGIFTGTINGPVPYYWIGCPSNDPADGNISTPDIIDNQYSPLKATDGTTFVGLVSYSNSLNNESIAGYIECSSLKTGVRYNFSFDAIGYQGQSIQQKPGFLKVWWSDSICDTSQLVFSDFINNDTPSAANNGVLSWKKIHVSFIADSNFTFLKFKSCYVGPDSLLAGNPYYYSYLDLDNISPIAPDTLYNSQNTPIILSKDSVCNGEQVTLTSPYTNEPDQYWYANGVYIGMGQTVTHSPLVNTHYVLTLGKDTCVRSVLLATVKSCGGTGVSPVNGLGKGCAVYPNPAKNSLTLQLTTANRVAESVCVYDVTGRLQKSFILPANSKELEMQVSEIANGIYFIKVPGLNINTKFTIAR